MMFEKRHSSCRGVYLFNAPKMHFNGNNPVAGLCACVHLQQNTLYDQHHIWCTCAVSSANITGPHVASNHLGHLHLSAKWQKIGTGLCCLVLAESHTVILAVMPSFAPIPLVSLLPSSYHEGTVSPHFECISWVDQRSSVSEVPKRQTYKSSDTPCYRKCFLWKSSFSCHP